VDVLSLNPGGINTEFASVANIEIDGMEAGDVVKQALSAMGRNANYIPGFSNKARFFALKYLPYRLSSFFVLKIMKKVAGVK
jgi:short-subunit dehydrogenase